MAAGNLDSLCVKRVCGGGLGVFVADDKRVRKGDVFVLSIKNDEVVDHPKQDSIFVDNYSFSAGRDKLLMPADTIEFLEWRDFLSTPVKVSDIDHLHHVKYLFNTFWLNQSPLAQWFNISWEIHSADKMHMTALRDVSPGEQLFIRYGYMVDDKDQDVAKWITSEDHV